MTTGINRLVEDLQKLGYCQVTTRNAEGTDYAIISGFEVPAGIHSGRFVDLGIPVPADYPRSIGASVHVKANPVLFPLGNVPNVRNVINSALGGDWQYWSYRFRVPQINCSSELMNQINEVFRKN